MKHSAARPEPSEYAPAFAKYVQLPSDGDIIAILSAQLDDITRLLSGLSEAKAVALHPPYTWTAKQVIGHITDCERVFGHRVLWIARNGETPLASFDENAFMKAVDFNCWPLAELLDEFAHVRRSHVGLLRRLEPHAWVRQGVVADHPSTVRAFAYVMAGHAQHHFDILKRRLTN